MKKKARSLDDLQTGIKQLLSEDRCSFSDEEKVLLNECITEIQQLKKTRDPDLLIKILEVLGKLFVASDFVKDLFF